jgi:hypothetical protein
MSKRNDKARSSTQPSGWPVPLFLLLAFALGAGTTWLIMRVSSDKPAEPVIESFLPPANQASAPVAPAAPQTAAVPPAVAGTTPPDVSQMTPADAARTLGNWNYDQQNWTHAIEHYQQAITLGADNPDVRTDLGNCFRFLGQPEKALEQYQIAQKENPQHENSLLNQVSLFAQVMHDPERAATAANEFLTRFPQSPQAVTVRKMVPQRQP